MAFTIPLSGVPGCEAEVTGCPGEIRLGAGNELGIVPVYVLSIRM